MSTSGSVFSQTLQDVTNTKLAELAKKRKTFEKRKAKAIADAISKKDPVEKLIALSEGVKTCFSITATSSGDLIAGTGSNTHLTELWNLDRFIDQARFDPSITDEIYQQWEESLLQRLNTQSAKYEYADLYGQLVNEWLSNSDPSSLVKAEDEMQISDEFEQIAAKARLESKENWERQAFKASDVKSGEVFNFVKGVFPKSANKALKKLAENIQNFESTVLASVGHINQYSLQWVIEGLLSSDLLSDEKKQVLRDFKSNSTILTEIADVLDMRMSAIESWSWGVEVELEHRRRLNGTYDFFMHEDLLQAMFLQYIGVKWSVFFKDAFKDLYKSEDVWKSTRNSISSLEQRRREFYLLNCETDPNVQSLRQHIYFVGYFVSELLDHDSQVKNLEEGEEEARDVPAWDAPDSWGAPAVELLEGRRSLSAPYYAAAAHGQPQGPVRGAKRARKIQTAYEYDDSYQPENLMDAKQRLLHVLTSDILIKTRFQGEISCLRSQFDSWNASLPHNAILEVLKFFGISKKWLEFFKTFLKAPLKFSDDDSEPRLRQRGIPDAHVLSNVFSEVVLFCLDYAINQNTNGEPLWRLQDDFWFWSASHETCIDAWTTIEKFSKTIGVNLNKPKTGAVRIQKKDDKLVSANLGTKLPKGEIRWGMLCLSPKSGKFEIDRKMVDRHISELSKQLKDKEDSLFAWIKAYTTYTSVFFTTNFGKPANCYGREHVDMMLATHEHIQRSLFADSSTGAHSVVDWLKMQIENRFGVSDIPDGYVFFPTELGGLEVKNPFVSLLQIRDSVTRDPNVLLDEFEEKEQKGYLEAKKAFESVLPDKSRKEELEELDYKPPRAANVFMPFEEYVKYREQLNDFQDPGSQLFDVYEKLLKEPVDDSIKYDNYGTLLSALNALGAANVGLKNIMSVWSSMSSYWQWVAQLYGNGIVERFGGLFVVDPGLLPIGMVGIFRSGRVKWQE